MSAISGYHHLTMSTDGAQEDFDFFTKDLGLYSVKRTVLFDGTIPVYHLYYGAKNGDESTIITTFPFRKRGSYGGFPGAPRFCHGSPGLGLLS